MWTKICGIQTPEHARLAAASGADAIGLVFVEHSPRFVGAATQAIEIVDALPETTTAVGLFVDAHATAIRDRITRIGVHWIQLHGSETPQDVCDLEPWPVIKALPFRNGQVEGLAEWVDAADCLTNLAALLIDAPASKGLTGGTGTCVDWAALRKALDDAEQRSGELPPLILAGGLTPQNVAEAAQCVRPWGVDVSSGVEILRGQKDLAKIEAFCHAAGNL